LETFNLVPEALSLLEHINRFGYTPKGEIIDDLFALYRQLQIDSRSTLQPVSIQRIAKSEPMLLVVLTGIGSTGRCGR
jgi:hypothetical protein